MLRRAALFRALRTGKTETFEAAMELRAMLDQAVGKPEEAPLVDLIHHHLLAQLDPDRDSETAALRLQIIDLLLDRGDRIGARELAVAVQQNQSMASPEERAKIVAAVGALPGGDTLADLVGERDVAEVEAMVAARWGDAARAEKVVAGLDGYTRCPVAVALAKRRRLEHADPAGWLALAEATLDAIDETARTAFVRCASDLGLELQAAGDRSRAAAVFARVDDLGVSALCELLADVRERVDATLLDGPILLGARLGAEDPSVTWGGCPTLLAELASRRGDRRIAERMWARAKGDFDGWEEDRGFDYVWSTSVRLGRNDPLTPHELADDAFRMLSLARIFDDAPDARVDVARLVEALRPQEDQGQGAGDEGEDGSAGEEAAGPDDAP